MKKIVYGHTISFDILNPKEYIIIEEDNQRISDKYVDIDGDKINEYKRKKALKKDDVVIRGFYHIWFGNHIDIPVFFGKFKHYIIYRNRKELTSKLKQNIKMKNSFFDFDNIKDKIIKLFSRDVKIVIP